MSEDLKGMIGENEKILWEGKPSKKCFILESIFNPLLPFALIWAILDFGIIGTAFSSSGEGFGFFLVPFFLLHLMPVWIYLAGIIFSFKKYKNTYYIVTDQEMYLSEGMFSKKYIVKPFAELSHVNLRRGIFDQMLNCGDIEATTSEMSTTGVPAGLTFRSISNYNEVYKLVKKLQIDIYTDVMYPNDKRPEENHGYKTKYKGED
jgi:uncharacterized membrane protein YdbT with pleckstrin-like domain